MKGAFSGGTSLYEKVDAVRDYGKALVWDPVNLVSLGIGKLAAGDGRLAEMLNATKMVDGKETLSLAQTAGRMANPETLMGQAKLIGGQGSVDYGIKAAELNEDALADYNRMLAEQGIADKAGRRAAIRAIYSNTGTWDMDEVDSMLDTYGYRTGGRVGYADGDMARKPFEKGSKKKDFEDSDFYNSFKYAKEGLESLEEAEDEIKPLPIRELRLARGGITDIEVEEGYDDGYGPDVPGMFEEIETTTEEDTSDMMASNPEVMDSLNELSLMLFRRPLSDLSEDEYEELKDFAGQTSLKPGLIDEYRNYKYNAEEQGQTPMSPRDYFRMEFGAARMGVKKGGKVIELMPKGILYKGKAKDYPGIKQLIKDMKKKGTRPKKAEGGLMSMGGNEMDLRGGGFVPMGAKERADDVPARLSKNEFVMTADAVRGAGGGSVQKGADLMYDQMKRLEGQA